MTDRDGRADSLNPVALSDGEHRRMRQILASKIRPFLPGVTINPVDAGGSAGAAGFYVIIVPRSADAPHAVAHGDTLRYYVRDDTTTRTLSAGEVAARYRDRFAARIELRARLDTVHDQEASRLQRWPGAWLSVAAVPTLSGNRTAGSAALGRTHGFMTTWARYACPRSALHAAGRLQVIAGIGRAIMSAGAAYRGSSGDVHLELHYNGAGFAAVVLAADTQHQDGQPLPPAVAVERHGVELEAQALVSLLAAHCADTGAGGELLL